jgi:hypothetical protein
MRPIRAVLGGLMLLAVGFSSASCNLMGAALYKITPPPAVEAKYKPAGQPMLILVENFANPSANFIDAQRLTAQLAQYLEPHIDAPLVDPDKLYRLRDADLKEFRKMSIPQVGQATGAQQVLYVSIQSLSVETDGITVRGSASATVKIVDATTGQTRWPLDLLSGYPVAQEVPLARVDSSTSNMRIRTVLVTGLADQIAKLFYKWTPTEGIQ